MGKNNRTRNVASFVRPGDKGVRLHLPNGKSVRFVTAAEAQSYIDIQEEGRKKGGRLVKKKIINGKKTCK